MFTVHDRWDIFAAICLILLTVMARVRPNVDACRYDAPKSIEQRLVKKCIQLKMIAVHIPRRCPKSSRCFSFTILSPCCVLQERNVNISSLHVNIAHDGAADKNILHRH